MSCIRAFTESSRSRNDYVGAWDAIAKSRRALAAYDRERRLLGGMSLTSYGNSAFNTILFNPARILVRLAEESAKPDAERLPEYSDARRGALEAALYTEAPVYEDFEQMKLAASLGLLRRGVDCGDEAQGLGLPKGTRGRREEGD